jgi:hypothetical protein
MMTLRNEQACLISSYEIMFDYWEQDGQIVHPQGYHPNDYFDDAWPEDFPTREAAETWLFKHYIGEDVEGVNAIFVVQQI